MKDYFTLFLFGNKQKYQVTQKKMLVLVNGNNFKIDRQQHNSTSNSVSSTSLIAKFIRYYASSIASLCVTASDRIWRKD
jgi:hypothetical protein